MTKSKSIEIFLNHLEDDLTWRKTELSKLYILYIDKEDLLMAKSIILFLYSHWEGYVKNATKQYLYLISQSNVKNTLLTKNFEAVLLKDIILTAKESSVGLTITNESGIIDKLDSIRSQNFTLPKRIMDERNKEFINTHDNLTLNNFNKILKIIGFPVFEMPQGHEKYLDENLINKRNAIVHGTKINPMVPAFKLDKYDIIKIREVIFTIMDYVKDELIYYIDNELYLKSNEKKSNDRAKNRTDEIKKDLNKIINPELFIKKAKSNSF